MRNAIVSEKAPTPLGPYSQAINDFAEMNEVYETFFAAPFPARTTIQAGALPGGIAVEIECIAKKAGAR
jgi:enamine deaminase RidA (YjgF/YER057c/UK114 family)